MALFGWLMAAVMSPTDALLPASAVGMWVFSRFGQPNPAQMIGEIEKLHQP